jgi:hypothetical protein
MSTSPAPAGPRSPLQRWLLHGHTGESAEHAHHESWPWYRILWLTGVDYFSTLGYQPGIALLAAGLLSPLATAVLVLVTLFGALPIYREVARRSYLGHGSISMLERLLPGWFGKGFVLALIGFASTDFVITMTLSAADAAAHAVENPYVESALAGHQMSITTGLLALLAIVFLRGFREAVGVATWLAVPYMVLNAVVLTRCGIEVAHRPQLVIDWQHALSLKGAPTAIALLAVLTFPKLALGLSGFETGVTVMPLVKGDPTDSAEAPPAGRIRNTWHLLTTAALIMSVFLVSSSFITTLLVPEEAWREGGEASGRALAYLAHRYMGDAFGTVYDVSTILILWFAGASAMAAMLSLIPRYLPRFGMAPHWVGFSRPLILVLFAIDVVVTLIFRANVEEQGGAYATGVLALILSAAVAVTIACWREAREDERFPWKGLYFSLVTLVFGYTFVDNILERPDGIIISSIFIASILALGGFSRWRRATEFRVEKIAFVNPESQALFEQIRKNPVSVITVRSHTAALARHKAAVRKHYKVEGPFAFVHVDLGADRSRFDSTVYLRVGRLGEDFRIYASNAVAVANTIAYVSTMLEPENIFLGLTGENPMSQAFRYLLWGEGETGILVYQILQRHWQETRVDEDVRPSIFLTSE